MGVDFLRRSAPSFRKGIDRHRILLATPTLFSRQPVACARRYAALCADGENLTVGEELCLHHECGMVQALRGLTHVATLYDPPSELLDQLVNCGGEAAGMVEVVHEISGYAELTVC